MRLPGEVGGRDNRGGQVESVGVDLQFVVDGVDLGAHRLQLLGCDRPKAVAPLALIHI